MRKSLLSEIIVAICVFAIGLCMILYAESMVNLITKIFGLFLILYGIINAINYLSAEEKSTADLALGFIAIVVGLVLVIKPSLVSEVISFVIGLYILLFSIPSLITGIKYRSEVNAVVIILPIIGIIIGILCLVGKFIVPDIILQFVGAMLITYSIINIIDSIIIYKNLKQILK